jgi:SUKH-4 immunity protein
MSNEEIVSYWAAHGEALTTFPRESLAGFGFADATLDVLGAVALPADASPYLNFDTAFERVSTGYQQGAAFAHFVRIGFDGAGNPVVVNTRQNDRVEWLDHEDGFSAPYVNASLRALSASLVVYHQFVETLLLTHGPDAYSDAVFTDEQLADLQRGLAQVDERAVAQGGFWQDEFTTLLANREHYKTN